MQPKELKKAAGPSQSDGFGLDTHLHSLLRYIHQKDWTGKENTPVDLEKISLLLKECQFEFMPKISPPAPHRVPSSTSSSSVLTFPGKATEIPLHRADCFIEDIEEKLAALEVLGKGFTKFEGLKLAESIKKIGADKGIGEVQFFGKVLATRADYFVFWAKDLTTTSKGDALSSIKFLVSQDLEVWQTLPPISAKTVRRSRQIKALMSGDLESQVTPDLTESDYLHAVLFRILFSNLLAPEGFFGLQPDSETNIERSAEAKVTAEGCAEATGWVHRFPQVMKYGDTQHPWTAEEEVAQKIDATDAPGKPLAPASADTRKWSVQISKRGFSFGTTEETQGQKGTQVIGVTNNTWPGALNYYSEFDGQFGFIYVGFGIKSLETQSLLQSKVAPVAEDIARVGLRDFKEPNPDEGHEVLETDSEPEPNSDAEKGETE